MYSNGKKLASYFCFYLTDCIRLQLVCMSVNKNAGNQKKKQKQNFADKFNVHFPVKLISFTIFIIVLL